MTERLHFHFLLSCTGEGNGSPLQCSCLENPRDVGAWWAAVYGVAQSRTRLKWLSSSSHHTSPPASLSPYKKVCQSLQRMKRCHLQQMDAPRDCHTEWRKSQERYHMASFIFGIQKDMIQINVFTRQTHRLTESREKGGEGIVKEFGIKMYTLLYLK